MEYFSSQNPRADIQAFYLQGWKVITNPTDEEHFLIIPPSVPVNCESCMQGIAYKENDIPFDDQEFMWKHLRDLSCEFLERYGYVLTNSRLMWEKYMS